MTINIKGGLILNKKYLLILLTILLIICWAIFYFYPVSIINIEPNDVSYINIFDGSNGKSLDIVDENNIEHIIKNLNNIKLKRDKLSIGMKGYSYSITIYKENNEIYKKFIINSKNTIRKDPFFYKDDTNSIDYDYIYNLIN
jgi:hypothetical protein